MDKTVRILAVAMIMMVTGCGRNKGPNVADEYVSGMDRIAEAVEKTKDEASARDAAQVIASVSQELEKSLSGLKEMSDAKKVMTFARNASELQRVQLRIAAAMQSLSVNPELLKIIGDEMNKIPEMQ